MGTDLKKSIPRRRPFGVIVIIIIQLAAILAIGGLDLFRLQPPIQSILSVLEEYRVTSVLSQAMGGLNSALRIVLPQAWLIWMTRALMLLGLFIVIGLWYLRRWAWVLIMMQVGLTMLLDLGLYFAGQPRFISMLASVVIVFYLAQRDVQQAFVHARASQLPERL